jgi:hypothetical protein
MSYAQKTSPVQLNKEWEKVLNHERKAVMKISLLASTCLLASLCATAQQTKTPRNTAPEAAQRTIRAAAVRAHMRFLSDSLLEGRYPGTRGYEIAARYVASQMEAMGLQSAGEQGTWFQKVPFLRAANDGSKSSLVLFNGTREVALKDQEDYIFYSEVTHTDCAVEAPVVFVGYGITAPELNYDDYAGVDVRGKIVAMISNAPPNFPSSQGGYYAGVVGKSRNAVAHGAIGRLEIFLPEDTYDPSGTGEWLERSGLPHDAVPEIHAWSGLTESGAKKLFEGAAKTLEEVLAAARAGQPQSFPLIWSARMHTVNTHQRLESSNVVGKVQGSDPGLRDQYVIYTAHLDHLGICPAIRGGSDKVCHGAWDNASGVATILEVARAFTALPVPPRRSVLFLFTNGEEDMFEGADFFAHFPTVPVEGLVAEINVDGMPGMLYPCKDLSVIGSEHSSLLRNAEAAARETGYTLSPDIYPKRNFFAGSDQYPFVLQGVPAVWVHRGSDGDDVTEKWKRTRYHTPLDNIDQPMDYEAGLKAARMIFRMGYEVAQQNEPPTWNKDDFFGTKFGRKSSALAQARTVN